MPLAPLSVGQHLHGDSASPGGGRFVIEKPLSAGGFAITYLARDQQLDDRCVIKELAIDQLMLRSGTEMVPLPGREADVAVWVQKVQKEAQTLHRLRSAGVVPIRATWRELGTAYFAMDFVDGIELPAEPTAGADWATWEPVARKFLAALGAIHAAGLVHGDIKPQNVLVNREGSPVIIDFGTARSTEEAKKTKLTTLAMTPGYCPPELAVRDRAKEMGPWSDLYSWALTVMGLVIRHGGIDGAPLDTSARMALAKHGHSDAGIGDESASALRAAGLPEGWVQALMACVALEPSARPQSAEEVAARIDAAPVKAKPAIAGAALAYASSKASEGAKLKSSVNRAWRRLLDSSSLQRSPSRKALFVNLGLGSALGLGLMLFFGATILGFQRLSGSATDTAKDDSATTGDAAPDSVAAPSAGSAAAPPKARVVETSSEDVAGTLHEGSRSNDFRPFITLRDGDQRTIDEVRDCPTSEHYERWVSLHLLRERLENGALYYTCQRLSFIAPR